MSGPKEFKILLDNNSSTFFGGQKVGGFVHIENVSRLDDIKGKLSRLGRVRPTGILPRLKSSRNESSIELGKLYPIFE